MAQCDYLYASGVRVESGRGVVEIDGKPMRVVRNGKGKPRGDRPDAATGTVGEVSLKDLQARLAAGGAGTITMSVSTESGSFSVLLDPSKAMGRQGRQGDFSSALNAMPAAQRKAAALYQLETLPYSGEQDASVTSERLRLVLDAAGGLSEVFDRLDARFGMFADPVTLSQALAFAVAQPAEENGYSGFRAEGIIRVSGSALADPARVSDEYFELARNAASAHLVDASHRAAFLDAGFERLDDVALKTYLRQSDFNADHHVFASTNERLDRIVSVDPYSTIALGLTEYLTTDQWRRVVEAEPEAAIGDVWARRALMDPTITSDDLFAKAVLADPEGTLLVWFNDNVSGLSSKDRLRGELLDKVVDAAPNTAIQEPTFRHLGAEHQTQAIAAATPVQIAELAASWTFSPTTKQAKQYQFARSTADMPPMSYAVVATEEEVVTITAAGAETRNSAAPGDVIMSGPSGERYVVKAAKFGGLYDGEVGATVIPNQSQRLVKEYEGAASVVFVAPWGERMILNPGDYVVSDGPDAFYRIARVEFEDTYVTPA